MTCCLCAPEGTKDCDGASQQIIEWKINCIIPVRVLVSVSVLTMGNNGQRMNREMIQQWKENLSSEDFWMNPQTKKGSESSTKGICQYRGRRAQLTLLIAQASAFRMHLPLWFWMINKSYTAIFLWLFPSKHKTSPFRHHAAGRQNTWIWNWVFRQL